jgi:hypothetical protein
MHNVVLGIIYEHSNHGFLGEKRNTQNNLKMMSNHWLEYTKMKPSLIWLKWIYGMPNSKSRWENPLPVNWPCRFHTLVRPIFIVIHSNKTGLTGPARDGNVSGSGRVDQKPYPRWKSRVENCTCGFDCHCADFGCPTGDLWVRFRTRTHTQKYLGQVWADRWVKNRTCTHTRRVQNLTGIRTCRCDCHP